MPCDIYYAATFLPLVIYADMMLRHIIADAMPVDYCRPSILVTLYYADATCFRRHYYDEMSLFIIFDAVDYTLKSDTYMPSYALCC